MNINTALVIVIVGALAGAVSGMLANKKGKGFRPIVHIVIGIIGAFHGRWLLDLVGIQASTMVGHVIFAAVGAALFVYLLRFIKPA